MENKYTIGTTLFLFVSRFEYLNDLAEFTKLVTNPNFLSLLLHTQ